MVLLYLDSYETSFFVKATLGLPRIRFLEDIRTSNPKIWATITGGLASCVALTCVFGILKPVRTAQV